MKRFFALRLIVLALGMGLLGCDMSGVPTPTPVQPESESPTATTEVSIEPATLTPKPAADVASTEPTATQPATVPSPAATSESRVVIPTQAPLLPTNTPQPAISVQSPLPVTSTAPQPSFVRVINTGGQGVNMRALPYTDAAIITILPEGGVVAVAGPDVASGGNLVWGHVQLPQPDGRSGYALATYLEPYFGPTPGPVTPAPTRPRPTPDLRSPTPDPSGYGPPPTGWSQVVRMPPGNHRIALTFDAGASGEPMPRILATLRERNVRITMFFTGKFAEQYPDGVRQAALDGHEIANHTYSHRDSRDLSDQELIDELARTEQILFNLTGRTSKPYWRPPFGAYDNRVLNVAVSQGYRSIYWTLDSLDSVGNPKTPDFIFNRVTNTPGVNLDGAIILQHFGSDASAEALPRILDRLQEMGLQVVTVSDLLSP